ncbi:MAG TPA: hypothetical protein VI072_15090 [Polyangiaceae bacterium]
MKKSRAKYGTLRPLLKSLFVGLTLAGGAVGLACGPTPAPGVGGAGGGGNATGLPCDVQTILQQKCQQCHGNPTNFAAPMPLVTHADLTANGRVTTTQTVHQLVAQRVADDARPMPPAPHARLSAAEIAVLQNWSNSGAPAGGTTCGGGGTGGSGGGGVIAPADCRNTYELRAHGQQIAGDTSPYPVPVGGEMGNKYMCFYFAPPYAAGSQAFYFDSLFDKTNTKYLHHWLLYGIDNKRAPDNTFAPCSAAEPGAYLLAGWAPGAQPNVMKPDVGLGMPSGPNAQLILEVHYYNPNNELAFDSTGVKFCTAPGNTRPHTAGVHFTGSEGICIEPNSTRTISGECVPRGDMGDVHINSVWPHMHQMGRRMKIDILRANGTVEVLHDAAFDFNSQISYDKGDVVLRPGDRMRTDCTYQNTSTRRIPFGEKTQDEMCFGFIVAWPAGALAIHPLDPRIIIGGGLQPARRCLDPLGIFSSCNGLADYP